MHDTINQYPGVAYVLISSEFMSYVDLSEWQTNHVPGTLRKRIGSKLDLCLGIQDPCEIPHTYEDFGKCQEVEMHDNFQNTNKTSKFVDFIAQDKF